MEKIIELVVVVALMGLALTAFTETFKDKFLALSIPVRMVVIVVLVLIASGLAYVLQYSPKVEESHFVVPFPVPIFNHTIEITTQVPFLKAVAFGIVVTFFAITEALKRSKASETQADRHDDQVASYTQNPLALYPMLALSYKMLVLPPVSTVAGMAFFFVIFLAVVAVPLTRRPIQDRLG